MNPRIDQGLRLDSRDDARDRQAAVARLRWPALLLFSAMVVAAEAILVALLLWVCEAAAR